MWPISGPLHCPGRNQQSPSCLMFVNIMSWGVKCVPIDSCLSYVFKMGKRPLLLKKNMNLKIFQCQALQLFSSFKWIVGPYILGMKCDSVTTAMWVKLSNLFHCDKISAGPVCTTHLLHKLEIVTVSSRLHYWRQLLAARSSRLKPPATKLGSRQVLNVLTGMKENSEGTIRAFVPWKRTATLVSKVSNKPGKSR